MGWDGGDLWGGSTCVSWERPCAQTNMIHQRTIPYNVVSSIPLGFTTIGGQVEFKAKRPIGEYYH
jgi:hypothetical protein